MSDEEDWPEYTGVLHEKVLISEDYILELYKDGNHSFEEIIWNKITNARAEKMNALFSLYNIDQDDPRGARKLVANLAVRHIRGFQFEIAPNPKRPGRPSKTSTPEYDKALYWLLNQYDHIKSQKKSFSKNNICIIILKRRDFPDVLLSSRKLPSVRRLSEHLNVALGRRFVLTANALVEALDSGHL